jgi:hypothetical protein
VLASGPTLISTQTAYAADKTHAFVAAAFLPAIRPNTRDESIEQLPSRTAPWTPPVASPAAYRPGIGLSLAMSVTRVSASILMPPIV